MIIVGAPRSGTNMLRDLVTAIDGFSTWPCDEIPGIWRHGNLDHPNDELTATHATAPVTGFIRNRFIALGKRTGDTPVEKTCATSLRLPFVDAVFPEARYIFIVRHGLDATASAMQRWKGSASFGYLARKARWTPVVDLPRYVGRTVKNRIRRLTSGEPRLATWGPVFDGMSELAAGGPLHDVCAEQWRRCVTDSADFLDTLPAERVLRLRYEDVTRDPAATVSEISDFLDIPPPDLSHSSAYASISSASIGKGARTLDADQTEAVLGRIGETLTRLGYDETP